MQKKIKREKWLVILLVLVAFLAAGIITAVLFRNGDPVHLKKGETLERYSYTSGGGMDGGWYKEEITLTRDGEALLTVSDSDWWGQDPVVQEYQISADALKEIEAICRKYKMQKWNDREFTRELIMDGGYYGYHFNFTESNVDFSSQIYPMRYRRKLEKLDEIVDRYREKGELLPGLVPLYEAGDYEHNSVWPEEGEFTFLVYGYEKGYVQYRFLNGLDEAVTINDDTVLSRIENGVKTQIFTDGEDSDWTTELEPRDTYEYSQLLPERLTPGTYCLEIGAYSCEFEIR